MAISELTDEAETADLTDDLPLRILVVDASPQIGELIKHSLMRVEHTVDVVSSSSEALGRLEHSSYDVVISEQYLGCSEVTGSDLARQVRRASCEPGFILATDSLASVTDVTNVDAVLLKPFCLTTLRETVARIAPPGRG
jgi:CheY-like chemotaxis protein